jgi:TonB-linked SusC/RagA family outer membrane protein
VDEKELKNRPVGSFDQVLQGRAPGLTLLTGSGQPGTASTVIIRGSGSIFGGTDPVYILDGIQVEAGVFQGINTNDIASLEVLRDAAATSLYGSRASAGVIVITTKRGSGGKLKLSYGGQFGMKSRPDFAFRPMNTSEILAAQEAYGKIVGASASTTVLPGWYYSTQNPRYAALSDAQKAEEQRLYDSIKGINTDWQSEIFRNGNFSNHQLALSGAMGKARIYSNLALYNEEGTTLRTDMNRVSWRNNIDVSDDRLTFSVNTNLAYTKRSFQQSSTTNSLGNPFLSSSVAVPYHNVYNPDGSYATGIGTKFAAANQLDLTSKDLNYNNQVKVNLGVISDYKITNEWHAGIVAGIDFRETQNTNYGSREAFVRQTSTSITGRAGFQTEGLSRYFQATVRPNIGYRTTINEKHNLDINVYGEYVKEMAKSLSLTGYGIDPRTPNTPAAITQGNGANQLFANVGGGKSENAIMGGLFTAKYVFDNKYTITGSVRNDWSSKLPENNRSATFWSLGAVWDVMKENFMDNVDAIDVLRLKVSYGGAGNHNNFPGGDYPYQATYGQGQYSGLNTIVATYPGNPSLTWERTYTTNIGIDYEILNRRIYGDFNLYEKITKDLFVAQELSATAGFGIGASLNINSGKLSNKGFEWNINGEIIRKKDFVWTVFTNGGYNKNRVLSLGQVTSFEVGTELVTVGLPLGSHYEVGWAGVDAATGQPLYYTRDGRATNIYDAENATQNWGTWEAPWRGGFGTNLEYKNFDLSILFSWQKGATKVDNMEYFLENPVGFLAGGYNQSSDLRFWQQPGDIVNTPSPLYGVNFSSKIIHDASFLRLRDIKLAYNFPRSALARTKFISNASVYVQGTNLFIWTKWRGMDPEAGATNINLSEFPNPRTVTAGIDITF